MREYQATIIGSYFIGGWWAVIHTRLPFSMVRERWPDEYVSVERKWKVYVFARVGVGVCDIFATHRLLCIFVIFQRIFPNGSANISGATWSQSNAAKHTINRCMARKCLRGGRNILHTLYSCLGICGSTFAHFWSLLTIVHSHPPIIFLDNSNPLM